MSISQSEPPERPTDTTPAKPDPQQEEFNDLYTKYSHKLESFARAKLPVEDAQDVLCDVWGFRVWGAIKRGAFQNQSESKQSGLLFTILKRAIIDHRRKQKGIRQLIAASLDDETAADSIEMKLSKQQDDPIQHVMLRERWAFLVATGEQCLTNEKHLTIFHRLLEGETKRPEDWDSADYASNKYRTFERLRGAIKKALGQA